MLGSNSNNVTVCVVYTVSYYQRPLGKKVVGTQDLLGTSWTSALMNP